LSLTEGYSMHESHLVRLDLNGWAPGTPVTPEVIFTFDDRVRALSGSCLLGPGVLAVADCSASLIWRVDLTEGARGATARVWAEHDTMAEDPDGEVPWPPQPGVDGVRYGYLYYTSTAQRVFMSGPVDPATLDASGPPEFVAAIDNGDDFCVDEDAGFARVTRHRANTLDRVPLAPRHGSEVRHMLGEPFDPVIVGPSSAYWGREPGHEGRMLYVTTDGGTTAPRRASSATQPCSASSSPTASDRGEAREPAQRNRHWPGIDRDLRRGRRHGLDVVVLPFYGRDGGDDFDPFSTALAEAGYRVLRPQPRGIARSAGPNAPAVPTAVTAAVIAIAWVALKPSAAAAASEQARPVRQTRKCPGVKAADHSPAPPA
jgi:hypothetical protein